jgi:hypothetical protein
MVTRFCSELAGLRIRERKMCPKHCVR